MTVIRPLAVPPAALQTAGQSTSAGQAPAVAASQLVAAAQAVLAEQAVTLAAVLQQAMGEAAPRQGGLAPLMADAEAMLGRNGTSLPPQVTSALQELLATRLPGQGSVDAAKLQLAVKQSGVFLESGLASGQPVQGDLKAALFGLHQALQNWLGVQNVAAPGTTAAPPNMSAAAPQAQAGAQPATAGAPLTVPASGGRAIPPASSAPTPPSMPLRDAALRLLAETDAALARPPAQPVATTDTPLKSHLEAMLAHKDAPIPQNVRAAMQTVLTLRPQIAGNDASRAQASFPQMAPAADPLLPQAAAGDLKSALLALRDALQNWLTPKPETALPQHRVQSPATPPQHAHTPAPPLRNGPTIPQAPAPRGSLDGLPLREAGLRILAETEAALARHTLLQIASLPEEGVTARGSDTTQRFVFDIPLATPQGTAIVQLRIERDGKRNPKGEKNSVWQAVFSIDVEPIGPVHARVAMVGEVANVALFAERSDSAAALRENAGLLAVGLAEAALEPGDILCATGAPASPAAAPGLFVDRAS
jgi:hypothetical protein